jgi:RNA polymerase sigma-70 factor (ECF subfamily)
MKTWSYLQGGNEVDNIKAFLYKVAKNLIIDYRRKKKSYSLDAITETGIEFSEGDESEDATNKFDRQFVLSQLEKLDPDAREILTMRYVNEMSIKEISEATDLTPNNVSVKIHRSIDKMKHVLKDFYEI